MKYVYLVLFVCLASHQLIGQKLKYKDIYAKLEMEQYEAALPDLTTFLEANPDHASATIYMGVVAQEFEKDCEKSKLYFDKAMSMLDQKELDKNEKYYGLWIKRNKRTGKYGVLLDNVRLDVDDRLNNCGD